MVWRHANPKPGKAKAPHAGPHQDVSAPEGDGVGAGDHVGVNWLSVWMSVIWMFHIVVIQMSLPVH